jgi:hypothetical protein
MAPARLNPPSQHHANPSQEELALTDNILDQLGVRVMYVLRALPASCFPDWRGHAQNAVMPQYSQCSLGRPDQETPRCLNRGGLELL